MTVTSNVETQAKSGQTDFNDPFVATIWHELRNPLGSLRIALQLLATSTGDPSAVSRLQARMVRQLEHVVRVVDDVLDTARVKQGELRLRLERTSATAVVRMAIEMSEPLVHAASHRLMLELPEDPLWLDVDPLRLTQIITNLLHNAVKYTNPQGIITVGATQNGDRIEIFVHDTGIGMTPDELDRVFELFARSCRRTVRATGGLGIGLALSRRLAEMHRGSLTATSDGLGRGSQFTLSLPGPLASTNTPADAARVFSDYRNTCSS